MQYTCCNQIACVCCDMFSITLLRRIFFPFIVDDVHKKCEMLHLVPIFLLLLQKNRLRWFQKKNIENMSNFKMFNGFSSNREI